MNNKENEQERKLQEEQMLKEEAERKRIFIEEASFFANRAINHRVELTEHENNHSWLCLLIDAYAIIDGATSFLFEQEAQKNSHCACKVGCHYCCIEPIPASPLESLGLAFAVRFLLNGKEKDLLQKQILEQNGNPTWQNGTCPFLVNGKCSIYQLRPIACRNYLAFNSPCYLREGGNVIFHNEIENFRAPSYAALQLANMHMTQTSKEMGLYQEDAIINFDNAKEYYLDIRTVKWLTDDRYKRFFGI